MNCKTRQFDPAKVEFAEWTPDGGLPYRPREMDARDINQDARIAIKTKKGESRERCAERNRANDSGITNRGKAVTEIEQTQPFLVNLAA